MATATTAAKATKTTEAKRTPPPAVDFGAVKAKASETPVTQTRKSALDSTPVPQWLAESWSARTTVQRGGHDRIEGAAVELSPMSREQVDYIKRLMSQCVVSRMPGVGVKFEETVNADKSVTLKFQTMQRKARKTNKSE